MFCVVFLIVFGSIECATRRFDSPPITNYNSRSTVNYIPLEVMNPLNQAKSSSYSFVDTSGGSGQAKIFLNPHHDSHHGDNLVGRRKKKPRLRPHQFEGDPPARYSNKKRGKQRFPNRTLPYRKVVLDNDKGHSREQYFDEEDGEKFDQARNRQGGARDRHSFKQQESYDQAEKKNRGREENKEALREKHGYKKDHMDHEKLFGKHFSGREGEKGVSIKKNSGYEKTYRKKSSRKVHNKSEYKLDEEFFENSRDAKDFKQHRNEHEKHAKEKADAVKKNHLNAHHHEGQSEKNTLQDKSAQHEEKAGHKEEVGEKKHEEKHSERDKKTGIEADSKHDHAKESSNDKGFLDFINIF